MQTIFRSGLVAAFLVGLLATSLEACWRVRSYSCYTSSSYYPCWPCYPPDTTPLKPPPPHPVPHTLLKHKLTLQNKSYSEAFAIIYIRHPDHCYRVYDKAFIKPGTSITAPQPNGYFAGDHLLIETWSRGTSTDYWHCRCCCFVTLSGASSTFDVINCRHTHPKPSSQEEAVGEANPATIVVHLPADAKLTIDEQPTVSTSGQRTFVTPPLESGKEFRYTLKAQVTRNGETRSVSKEVTVQAGRETRVQLDFSTSTVAAK